MDHNKILSIIIPVYNVEKYLEQCLGSIIDIKYQNNIEIILVNDGSTDNSPIICQKYAELYPNIKLISQKNSGLSEARNTGIMNANGEYLLFLDSDDFLFDEILDKILFYLKNYEKDLFIGRAYKYFGNFNQMQLSQIDYNFPDDINPDVAFDKLNSIKNFWFAAWLIIIKRDFLISNELFFKKGILHEDELWVPSVFIKAESIGFLNFGFYCYRLNRKGSIVSNTNIKREFDKLIVASELSKFYGKNKISDKIINDRRAAIEFGLIKSLQKYTSNDQYESLKVAITQNLDMLNFGKYRLISLLTKIFGVSNTSRILNLR